MPPKLWEQLLLLLLPATPTISEAAEVSKIIEIFIHAIEATELKGGCVR